MEQGKEALKNFLHAIAPSDSKKRRVLCKGRNRLWVLQRNLWIVKQYHIYIFVEYEYHCLSFLAVPTYFTMKTYDPLILTNNKAINKAW